MDKIMQVFSNDKNGSHHATDTPLAATTVAASETAPDRHSSSSTTTANDDTAALGTSGYQGTTGTGRNGATGAGGLVDETSQNTHNTGVGHVGPNAVNPGPGSEPNASRATGGHHTMNHSANAILDKEGAAAASHDHKHLAAVTHEKIHHHETEEIQRQRDVDRHVHHVQHHVQPVADEHHHDRVHKEHIHPTQHIHEHHTSKEHDHKLLAGLNKERDHVVRNGTERTVVDNGEIVNEQVNHHVHHVVQPVIERDTHQHSTIHTTVPIKHTTHEAPIVHQSVTHAPMHIKDFVGQGGDLNSTTTLEGANLLSKGDCAQNVSSEATTTGSRV